MIESSIASGQTESPSAVRTRGTGSGAAQICPMNKAQFQTFYDTTYPRLWRYVFRLAGDSDLSDDVVQESYIRLLRNQPRGFLEQTCRSYLFTIATNLVRDTWRQGKIRGQWTDHAESESERDSSERVAVRLDVAAALERLSLMQRSLLWLSYVEGYTHNEVAAMLDVQPASVRVLLMRARRRMAEILGEMEIEKESL